MSLHPAMQLPALLRSAAIGTYTTLPILQREVGYSRNWTRTLCDGLAQQGFVERKFLPKAGRGRPAVAYRLTPFGRELLNVHLKAEAARFTESESAAGPLWSLAEYGFAFIGSRDAFVARHGRFSALAEVFAPHYLLSGLEKRDGILFPSPEALVVWLLESGEDRFVLAAPYLASESVKDWDRLWSLAADRNARQRLAYVLAVTGQNGRIPSDLEVSEETETLLPFATGVDDPAARRFNVKGTPTRRRFEEFHALYRGGDHD